MALQERLLELQEEGQQQDAESLAKGAISSQRITDIEVGQQGVRVKTQSFIGMHLTSPSAATILEHANSDTKQPIRAKDVEITGSEYHLQSDQGEFRVRMEAIHWSDVIDYIDENFNGPAFEPEQEPENEEETTQTLEEESTESDAHEVHADMNADPERETTVDESTMIQEISENGVIAAISKRW